MARIADPERPDHWVAEHHNRRAGADKAKRAAKRRHRRRHHRQVGRGIVAYLSEPGGLKSYLSR